MNYLVRIFSSTCLILLTTTIGKRDSLSASPTPGTFSLAKDEEQDKQAKAQTQDDPNEQISAADYDPNLDFREDEQKRARAVVEDQPDIEMVEEEEVEEEEEDLDDMFAVLNTEKKVKKIKKVRVRLPLFLFKQCF